MENAAYWRGMLADGPAHFFDNVAVEAGAICCSGRSWPVTRSDRVTGSAYPASLHAHYVAYPRTELDLVPSRPLRAAVRAGLAVFDRLARMAAIDRTVQWSSWLLSTNLHGPGLGAAVPEVTRLLLGLHPRHALLVRCIHGFDDPGLPGRFAAAGYELVTARQIYLFDGRDPGFLKTYNVKRDLKGLSQLRDHRLVGPDQITESDAPRVRELYRMLYLERHAGPNPAYTVEFVRRAIRERWLDFRGLRHSSGRLDAVAGCFHAGGVASTPFFGHDTTQPTSLGLYRILMAQLLRETAEAGRVLNYSSGAGAFKRHRGAVPLLEYNALYTRHLPPLRRAAFAALRQLANGPGRRFLEREGV